MWLLWTTGRWRTCRRFGTRSPYQAPDILALTQFIAQTINSRYANQLTGLTPNSLGLQLIKNFPHWCIRTQLGSHKGWFHWAWKINTTEYVKNFPHWCIRTQLGSHEGWFRWALKINTTVYDVIRRVSLHEFIWFKMTLAEIMWVFCFHALKWGSLNLFQIYFTIFSRYVRVYPNLRHQLWVDSSLTYISFEAHFKKLENASKRFHVSGIPKPLFAEFTR
jgi:hypothetical protein